MNNLNSLIVSFVLLILVSCSKDRANIQVQLSADFTKECPTFNMNIECLLKDISIGQISRREWFFENALPTYSNETNPIINFNKIGETRIMLVVHNDELSITDTIVKTINVYPSSGLVAYYPLDSTAQDLSGNNFHGEIYGTTLSKDVLGEVNHAIEFQNNSDYIITSIEIDELLIKGASFSAWIKTSDSMDISPIMTNYNSFDEIDTCQSKTGFNFYYGTERGIGLTYKRSGHSFGTRSDEHNNFDFDEWHHVVVTWNGELGFEQYDINTYIDGEKTSGSSGHFNLTPINCPFSESPKPFYIGNNNYGRLFLGVLDEIRIYDRELSIQDIKILSSRI